MGLIESSRPCASHGFQTRPSSESVAAVTASASDLSWKGCCTKSAGSMKEETTNSGDRHGVSLVLKRREIKIDDASRILEAQRSLLFILLCATQRNFRNEKIIMYGRSTCTR
mmetsp:Transcript_23593/g.52305  ORF Transcript_23593/g.52305 Transcript_23593/m.52305 type:complete len:112 (-) Transcript_23593:133-468(-)